MEMILIGNRLYTEMTTGTGFIGIKEFYGKIDGNNCEIKNLYQNFTNNIGGLITKTIEATTIEKLGVSGEITAKSVSGGIVGVALKDITIKDSYSKVRIDASDVGGIVAISCANITVNNCYNIGELTGSRSSGGIVSEMTSSSDTSNVINNCYNTGKVKGGYRTGGIIGYSSKNTNITNSYNTGELNGNVYTGGIVANTDKGCNIVNCYNKGSVNGNHLGGGIGGEAISDVKIINCCNLGNIKAEYIAAGILGAGNNSYYATIKNVYVAGTVTAQTKNDICTASYNMYNAYKYDQTSTLSSLSYDSYNLVTVSPGLIGALTERLNTVAKEIKEVECKQWDKKIDEFYPVPNLDI